MNRGWEAEEGAKDEALKGVDALRVRMLRAMEILFALRALFEVKPEVSRTEFSRFVKSALNRLPELQALEWIPRVDGGERSRYEASARRDGLETFSFREISPEGKLVVAGQRDEYLPVFYVEPTLTNFSVLGLDLRANACRRMAMDRAAATGEPTATSPLQLAQMAHHSTGFLVILVVRDPKSGETLGYCLAVYRVDRVVEEVFAPLIGRGVELEITDLGDPQRIIFPYRGEALSSRSRWTYQVKMEIAGRPWGLEFRPTDRFRASDPEWLRRSAEMLRRNNRLLEEKVKERTMELEKRNRELSSEILRRREAEEGLRRAGNKLSVLSESEARHWGGIGLVGRSARFGEVLAEMRQVQQFPHTNVLLTGESGTGKELIARAIHLGSPNATEPFVPVNCSALNSEDAEGLLFGADQDSPHPKRGYFDLASGGTLFLDEIGDMPLILQSKLLRVLEDGYVLPAGATEGRRIALRVIVSTNADLPSKVAKGAFRQDLYYRLMQFHIRVPSLRERLEDVPLLARHFVEHFARELNRPEPSIRPDALRKLTAHPYRGNIRELKNTIERAIIYAGEGELRAEHIIFAPQAALGLEPEASRTSDEKLIAETFAHFPYNLAEAEDRLIERALLAASGNVSEAARLLGVNRARIYRRKKSNPSTDR